MDIRVGSLISVRDYKVGQFWCKVSSCDGDVWPHHLCRIDHTVELFLADEAELEGGGLEREIAVHRMMRDLGRLVVADDRRECVTSISERCTSSAIFFRFGRVSSTRNLRKFVQPSASSVIDWLRLAIISGLYTFISR